MSASAGPDQRIPSSTRHGDVVTNEQELQALFDLIPDGVMLVDPRTTQAIRFNAAAHRQLGYSAEEFARLRVSDYEAEQSPEQIGVNIEKLILAGRVDFETRHRRKDGTLMDVAVSVVRMDSGGRPLFMSVFRDISARVAVDAENRQQRALFDQLLESVVEGVVVCDGDGHLIYFNHAARLWHGVDISKTPPEQWAAYYDLFQNDGVTPLAVEQIPLLRAFKGEVVNGAGMSIVAKGQAPRFINASATPLRDAGGRIVGAVAVMHDITESKRAQEQIRQSVERLNEAQRIAQVGSWELDLVTGQLIWSDEIFRLFEIDPAKFGATYEAFLNAIHPEDRDAVNQAYTQSLADRRPYEIIHRLRMADGCIKWVHERCTSEFAADGKPLRSVGTVQDITARRQAELALERLNQDLEQRVQARTIELEQARQEAERASQAKSDFLSRMSHELRTPMNAILGFSQLLESDEERPLSGEQKENVVEILHAGRHLLALINEMLDLARVESGRLDLSREPVELVPLLQECLSLVRPLAEQRRITLDAVAVHGVVQADRLRLRQVLLNLLSNAIKYNREAGQVQLSCQPLDGARVRIAVRDTGHGIAPEHLPRLFRPFERLESAYKGIEGTGIGLALTRRLAEAMDGSVGVNSVVGEGSTFWVELPLADRKEAAAQTQVARSRNEGKEGQT